MDAVTLRDIINSAINVRGEDGTMGKRSRLVQLGILIRKIGNAATEGLYGIVAIRADMI